MKHKKAMFKTGQKVVCVNNKPLGHNLYNGCLRKLKEGELYTVSGTLGNGLQLKEVKSMHPLGGFDRSRFRPIDTGWVDDLLAECMKETATKELELME